MAQKDVELVMTPGEVHWVGDGFRVHNFIPSRSHLERERMDPFILLDYNSEYEFAPVRKPLGVGVHPHRGFETVTIAYKGKVEHHDSNGGGGIIGEGDVQWMTAARGVLHKEFHEREWSEQGGLFQMVQLWINLPAKFKMSHPRYQAIPNSEMVRVKLPKDYGFVEVIAGDYEGKRGPAKTFSPVNLMNARLSQGGKAEFSFPANYNTALLVVKGAIVINKTEKAPVDHFVLFKNQGDTFEIEATEESVVLVMSGEPLNEPIVAHGPFVMNTKREIIQAFDDFNQGKFGYLKD
ncbi:pirin family protein [Oscillospiraceae bacterium N12]|jgi:redox-sensitive bicupin YhaK (pirin superfamily)|uniref:Pirin family protein n=1 Tax=Jilunia laotingensis TaxID=2763675 RepID=A0A926F7K5_9BACT|nr:pirin family protein [Jilunia laotingensis]MBC8593542.1 pirin family protein [Jilunia laotingensis]